jgi:MFS family permease
VENLEEIGSIVHDGPVGLGWSFRRFWAATGLSNVADGMFGVAIALAALELTRSPLQISALELATGLPWLLFGLVAGAIADRSDRRRLMVGVQVARAVALTVLALVVATGATSLWMLYLAALVMGVAETLFDTSAQTVLPKIVDSAQLERANSRLTGVELVGNFFVGPPLGGLLVALASAAAFGTGSALYLLAAGAVLTVRGSFQVPRTGPPTSIRVDIGEGLRYLRDQPLLRRLGVLTGARLFTFSAVSGPLVVYAVAPGPMGLSPLGYGLFCASTAIGAVASSITGERLVARIGAARCLHLTMLAFAVTELSPLAVNPFAVGTIWMVGTYFVIIWNVVTLTVRQRLVPEALLGRVNSAYRVVSWGVVPIGALFGGALAEWIGFRWTFVICAAMTALLALGTWAVDDEALTTGRMRGEPAREVLPAA